jgi:hypothetical protein
LFDDFFNMVYELLSDYFVLDNFVGGFDFFWDMWAHHSWSCSFINITYACCITTISFREINWRCSTHCNWRGGLLINCSHTCYSI